MATEGAYRLLEVPTGDHTKIVAVTSGDSFLDPVHIRSHIKLGRKREKPWPARCRIPHLTSERHGMIVQKYPLVGHGSVQ